MNTTENNKLIAEFMGGKRTVNGTEYAVTVDSETEFNKSWDLLIPAVRKCKENQVFGSGLLITDINHALINLNREQVYNAVTQFIVWYNSAEKGK